MSGDFGRHRLLHSIEFLTPEFQELDNDHRVVWLYCKAGPQSTSVGIYRLSTALAVEDLRNLTAIEFDARLLGVCDRYRWRLDGLTRVLWIPDWLDKNPPQSPNVVASWVKLLGNVPDCELKFEAIAAMGDYLKGMKPSFVEPFDAYRQRLSKDSRRAKAKTEPQSQPQSDAHQRSGIRDPRLENRGTGALRAVAATKSKGPNVPRPDDRVIRLAGDVIRNGPKEPTTDYLVDSLQFAARQELKLELRRDDALAAFAISQQERTA